ncbi:MAG: amidohydrolase family protein [Deltaproteobacteria bacterium]|nr:amidohydrolase family protein [Deltaproteobacteria bacterium]
MTYDLKIVGGMVVDGTGSAPRRADVAVRDGVIVAVGECADSAGTTIDAEGAMVTPGFVDLHCHYDGQVSWDPDLLPAVLHGVTTCIMGNCGVGFAPVRPHDRQRLIELMEGVEDIPGSALAEGIQWRWESFEEYMDAIDVPHALDVGAQVTHDPLRMYVMGDRAVAGEPATEADIAQMRELLCAAVRKGAVGFSTGRSDNHKTARGADTPAAEADRAELCGIVSGLRALGKGVVQAVSDFDMAVGSERFDGEFTLLEEMARASGRPFSVSLAQRDMDSEQWKKIIARAEQANQNGLDFRLQCAPRPIGVVIGLECSLHPFMGFPSYKRVAHLPLSERVAAMRDPEFRQRILSEKSDPLAGDGSAVPPLADKFIQNVDFAAMRLFPMDGAQPNYLPSRDQSLFARALNEGRPTLEVLYDALLEDDGNRLIYLPIYNYTEFNDEAIETMISHPLALWGLSDGGAHVGTICDASFPSFFLSYWARDRVGARFSVERVVKMLANDPARYLGLHDRGVIAVGKKADINVIDHAAIKLHTPRVVRDLPAGGRRLLQDVEGFRATVVTGKLTAQDGKLTGVRAGKLLRN